jgi:DNA processing protein
MSSNYSKLLKEIDNPPLLLYAKGDVSLLNSTCVAIVGTRRASRYGKDVTEQFSSALAKSGITIVSGLADGVDTFSHQSCVNAKGKTIAVLGGGINNIYPATNTNLANKIIETGGLIVSEYKPNEKPQTYYFPVRNRIIAGLSKVVLITEATEKSGSMHTKNYALEFGREVFAVPGRINDIYSSGCNKIIKTCQSAIALEPNDVLNFLGKNFVENQTKVVQYSLTDKIILDIIDVNEVHYEEILAKSGLDSKELNTNLIRLELKNLIKKLPGNFYSK